MSAFFISLLTSCAIPALMLSIGSFAGAVQASPGLSPLYFELRRERIGVQGAGTVGLLDGVSVSCVRRPDTDARSSAIVKYDWE